MKRLALMVCIILLLVTGGVGTMAAQTTTPPASSTAPTPKPWGPDEFPQWSNDLRRFEVVSIGAWPISYLWTSIVYDVARWSVYGLQGDAANASLYAPMFFAPANKPQNTAAETDGILLASIGVALTVGLVDYLIEQDRRRVEAERQAFRDSELLRDSLLQEEAVPAPDPAPDLPAEGKPTPEAPAGEAASGG